jgi:His/Glu/Gln/Arg/opine family amino acid ABC transporter permease subunit
MMDRLLHFFDPRQVWEHRDLLVAGLGVTLQLAALTFSLAIGPGLLVALGRRLGPRWLALPLAAIVNLVRCVPTLLTVVFIYLALPFAGVTFSAFASVLLGTTFMQIVFFSEAFRGALAAVGKGQFDAAYACGLRTPVVLRRVILPQAALVAAPAFASSLVLLVQNTSIASAVAVNDMIGTALNIQTNYGEPAPLVAAGLGYLALIVPLVRLTRRWERRMAIAL